MLFSNLILLLLLLLLNKIDSKIHYITSASIFKTCKDICNYKGYSCSNTHIENMDCKYAATDVCSKVLTYDNNHLFQCSYGGCYVNCENGIYADKSIDSTSCTSSTDCYNRQGSITFSRICACDTNETVALTVWQIIGIATGVFFFFSMICALFIYFYMDYTLKKEYEFNRIDDSENGKYEKQDSDKTWSNRYIQVKDSCSSGCIALGVMITAAYLSCCLFCRGSKSNDNNNDNLEANQTPQSEKKEKKSWLKSKFSRSSGKKKSSKEQQQKKQDNWYKEDGLPSVYEKPSTKERKSYSYEINIDDDDDSESIEYVREHKNGRKSRKEERVLSAYAEYQENSTDADNNNNNNNNNSKKKQSNNNSNREIMMTTNVTTTKNTTSQIPQNTSSAPPPLLSQRRHSISSAPLHTTTEISSTPRVSQSQSQLQTQTPSYQPKPLQAPPLLSQRSITISPSPALLPDRDDNSIRSNNNNNNKSSRHQISSIQNPMQSEPESDTSKSKRIENNTETPPTAVWHAGPGKIVKVSRRDNGYNWDNESHEPESSVVSDSSYSDISYASSVQQPKGRRIRGAVI